MRSTLGEVGSAISGLSPYGPVFITVNDIASIENFYPGQLVEVLDPSGEPRYYPGEAPCVLSVDLESGWLKLDKMPACVAIGDKLATARSNVDYASEVLRKVFPPHAVPKRRYQVVTLTPEDLEAARAPSDFVPVSQLPKGKVACDCPWDLVLRSGCQRKDIHK